MGYNSHTNDINTFSFNIVQTMISKSFSFKNSVVQYYGDKTLCLMTEIKEIKGILVYSQA